MALPVAFRDALSRLYDLVTGDETGCVSERLSYGGKLWKVRIVWTRDPEGKLRIDATIQQRSI